jgi:glucose uptake protein
VKGVILAVVGGLLIGSFGPLVQRAMESEIGLGPYSVTVIFAIGVLISTLVFSVFFMNLPVEGEPVELTQYARSQPKQHFLGWLGGAMWCTGSLAALVAAAAPGPTHLAPALNSLLAQGFPILAALWGLLVWREVREGDTRVKVSMALTLVLFLSGLLMLAAAPLRKG